MNIVLFGAPLSGKGTQAELITKKYGLVHISTGDMLRNIANQNSELGFTVKKLLDEGNLVPDEMIFKVLQERLVKEDAKNGILLDGFPRTLNQAKMLEDVLNIDYVIYIDVSKENILKRIAGRYVCESCKKTLTFNEEVKLCPECGGKAVKRDDDKEDIVSKRFDTFISYSTPILEFYKQKQKLIQVNGNSSIQDIFNQIEGRLK